MKIIAMIMCAIMGIVSTYLSCITNRKDKEILYIIFSSLWVMLEIIIWIWG